MARYKKIIFLSHTNQTTRANNFTLLADSLNLDSLCIKRSELFDHEGEADIVVAYAMDGRQITHKHVANDLQTISQHFPVFLFDADREHVHPLQALDLGVRGVIYHDEQLDRVLTALKVISNGQLYYPRRVLSDLVDEMLERKLEQAQASEVSLTQPNSLTKQELNVVKLVAEGARNKEVANHLNISAHTVKTHLSSIFRKTQARNRIELLRWSQQSNLVNYCGGLELKN